MGELGWDERKQVEIIIVPIVIILRCIPHAEEVPGSNPGRPTIEVFLKSVRPFP